MTGFSFGVDNDVVGAYNDKPSSHFKWKLYMARVSLATSAVAGNRQFRIWHGRLANQGEILVDTGLVPASTTKVATGGLAQPTTGEGGAGSHTPWGAAIQLAAQDVLSVQVTASQAGDTWTWDIVGEEVPAFEDAGG